MPLCLKSPDWDVEKSSWPHAEASRFIRSGRYRWHLQRFGAGPVLVLLHGTGASAHSFAELARLLARDFEVVMVDLPGHGFTATPMIDMPSPEAIASDLARLFEAEGIRPEAFVGHSAGAVVADALRMACAADDALLVSINGAFRPFGGVARVVAPAMARIMYLNPLNAILFAQGARNKERVRALIRQTGSDVPDENVDFYARLLAYPGHISGTLGLMANWNLDGVEDRMIERDRPALFIVGDRDTAVPPAVSVRLAEAMSQAELVRIPEAGHLVHEESPAGVAQEVMAAFARRHPAASAAAPS